MEVFLILCGIFGFIALTCYLVSCGEKSEDCVDKQGSPMLLMQNSLDNRFEEAYLWACDIFGVQDNVYDRLECKIKSHEHLSREYFTYYYVAKWSECYPRSIQQCKNKISDFENNFQIEVFANEFISIVNSIKHQIDQEDLKLLNDYGVNTKYLLTNEFKVDKLKLFNIEQ